ncbi:hypothetical protein JCM19241_1330 [Vibrio ishigakensis]|uniref:Uncharacterized protein n=1 Tax=Vibrio ishigakensis TaxID=1481914 RepID=A0A0B8QDI0_9VIBR|nr:hypothetical protein JCM19241_1330 [Vibrio ishigakensis]
MKVVEYAIMSALIVVAMFFLFSSLMAHSQDIWSSVLNIR